MKSTPKRKELIRVGRDIIIRQGFNAAGLSKILATANVPKGSFYYYFESKEDFGLAVIEDFAAECDNKLRSTMGNETLSPIERLSSYFEAGIAEMNACDCANGCLIGNLAQELSAQNDVFRDRLNQILTDWETQFATCLEAAHEAGELAQDTDTTALAQFILSGWEGAILKAKVARSTKPMQAFRDTLLHYILTKSTAG